jgi:hypothetical protein
MEARKNLFSKRGEVLHPPTQEITPACRNAGHTLPRAGAALAVGLHFKV